MEIPGKTIPREMQNEIDALTREIKRFQKNEIPEEKFKKFRLQQGIYGQRQKGVQMVRVKIPSGFLNAHKLRTLADVIKTYSAGRGHVTTRQDIQFHFVKLDDIPQVLYRLAEAGLTTREACGNTVRNVTSCHLAGICPTELFNVAPIAEATAYHLLRNPINQDLPRKFKISFSGCRSECGMAAIHDIGFIATSRNVNGSIEYGFQVYAGGGLGSSPKLAKPYADFLPVSDVLPTCEGMLKVFDAHGDRKVRSKARMKFVVEKWGQEKFKEAVAREIAILKEMNKVYPTLPAIAPAIPPEHENDIPKNFPSGTDSYAEWVRTNILLTSHSKAAVQIRLILGNITADALMGLAHIVDQFAPHAVRTTNQQNIILYGVDYTTLPDLYRALDKIGLASSGAERAVDVIACPGADSCQLALTSSMGVGADLTETLKQNLANDDIPGLRIRISGCPNSCAHHHIAGIGLHGVAKKVHGKLAPHYQLHLGGGVNADSPAFGKPKIKIPAKRTSEAVMKIIRIFRENQENGERFNDFVNRYGADKIGTQLIPFTELPDPTAGPEYYKDYNDDHDFHLDDLGPGECAGGVIDLIENYLRTSRQSLEEVRLELNRGNAAAAIDLLKNGILRACRALLIPFGIDSPQDEEILKSFQHRLVEQGFVSERFEQFTQLLGKWIDFDSTVEGLQAAIASADLFLSECREAYDQMDADMKLRKSESRAPAALSVPTGTNIPEKPSTPTAGNETAQGSPSFKIDIRLDLSGVACPMNFVKTKLQLEDMEDGQVLEVIIDDGEPKENVPRSVQAEGHKILDLSRTPNDHYSLVIEKAS